MGGGDKSKNRSRSDKKFAALAAQCKTPQHGPAKTPPVGPVRLNRIQEPLEQLQASAVALIAHFAGKEAVKVLSAVSRSLYVALESWRYGSGEPADVAARRVLQRVASRGEPVPAPLQALDDVSLESIAAHGTPDVVLRVAFAAVRIGRSLLHHVRRNEAPTPVNDWLVKIVTTGVLPLGHRHGASGRTLLHVVCLVGDRLLAQRLIVAACGSPHGFDVEVADSAKRTALHVAASEGMSETCLSMVKHSDVSRLEHLASMRDSHRRTVVECASHGHHSKLASALNEALHPPDSDDYDDYDDYDEADY